MLLMIYAKKDATRVLVSGRGAAAEQVTGAQNVVTVLLHPLCEQAFILNGGFR